MSCTSCSTGSDNTSTGIPKGCNNNGSCGTGGSCNKLNVFDWLGNMRLPDGQQPCDVVEIRFKNSRKEFYRNVNDLTLNVGDIVATESSPGHDIGVVSITGELVRLQLKKKSINYDSTEIKKIYRKAKQVDIDKWREAQKLEVDTMFKARTLALKLGLQMKISDVEFQGDKSKAIFYYTADGRVDFRELIKVLASEFKVKIEMRQIGARQEAGIVGGIGSCGRELCCSTWLTSFKSVNTTAARYQNLSINQTKLSGQCGRLKCCLNYELDTYLDALRHVPERAESLQLQTGDARLMKTDVLKGLMYYTVKGSSTFYPLTLENVKMVLAMNAEGKKPAEITDLAEVVEKTPEESIEFADVVGQITLASLDRKDRNNRNKNRNNNNNNRNNNQNKPSTQPQNKPANTTQNTDNKAKNTNPNNNQNRPANNQNRPPKKFNNGNNNNNPNKNIPPKND